MLQDRAVTKEPPGKYEACPTAAARKGGGFFISVLLFNALTEEYRMVSLLVSLLIIILVLGLIAFLIRQAPFIESPYKEWALYLVLFVGVIIIIMKLFPLADVNL